MSNAIDIAKYFIKNKLDTDRNTFDGNMKLQKLLFFADYISLAEKGKPLFPEPILAFSNGCVVEEVRLRYKNDCTSLCEESATFNPQFTQDEYDVLHLTSGIFGNLSARELSNLNHSFSFWKNSYERSKLQNGYKEKYLAIISETDMIAEVDKLKAVLKKYEENKGNRLLSETINGTKFFYSPDFQMTDDIIEQLDLFSRDAEDDAYSVYHDDDGSLVII